MKMTVKNKSKQQSFYQILTLCKKREHHNGERFERQGAKYPKSNILGIFCYALNAPFFSRNLKGIYFDSVGESFSKTGVALHEIKFGNFLHDDERLIVGADKSIKNYCARFIRLLMYSMLYAKAIIKINKKAKFTKQQKATIIGCLAFDRFFKRNPEAFPLIMSDMSINYLPLAFGGNKHCGVMWWQDDFHHRAIPNFRLFAAGILSRKLASELSSRNASIRLLQRELRTEIINVHTDFNEIGIAVNATFTASFEQLEVLYKLKGELGVENLSLRLHPTAVRSLELPNWVVVSSADELIEDFAKRHQLIFVGNSAIQLKLLAAGTPVFHIEKLDLEEFDSYNYVQHGLVYGAKTFDKSDLRKLSEFYSKDKHRSLLVEALA